MCARTLSITVSNKRSRRPSSVVLSSTTFRLTLRVSPFVFFLLPFPSTAPVHATLQNSLSSTLPSSFATSPSIAVRRRSPDSHREILRATQARPDVGMMCNLERLRHGARICAGRCLSCIPYNTIRRSTVECKPKLPLLFSPPRQSEQPEAYECSMCTAHCLLPSQRMILSKVEGRRPFHGVLPSTTLRLALRVTYFFFGIRTTTPPKSHPKPACRESNVIVPKGSLRDDSDVVGRSPAFWDSALESRFARKRDSKSGTI
jgi:hypothetical protein